MFLCLLFLFLCFISSLLIFLRQGLIYSKMATMYLHMSLHVLSMSSIFILLRLQWNSDRYFIVSDICKMLSQYLYIVCWNPHGHWMLFEWNQPCPCSDCLYWGWGGVRVHSRFEAGLMWAHTCTMMGRNAVSRSKWPLRCADHALALCLHMGVGGYGCYALLARCASLAICLIHLSL